MQPLSDGRPADEAQLSVGAVAARLGVAPGTVRSWGRRYGLLPSGRSAGGHRRYSERDVAHLVRMQALVAGGATPAAAARVVSAERSGPQDGGSASGDRPVVPSTALGRVEGRNTSGGPGGRVLGVPGASARTQGLARAASRLDAETIRKIVDDLLRTDGTVATWEQTLRPVLSAAGAKWARTGEGVDVEHVLSEATIDALRAHRARQLPPVGGRQILLACVAGDLHVLPLHVLDAALAERRVATLMLGARVPGPALVSAARRTRAAGIFLWQQQAGELDVDLGDLRRMRPAPLIVVGGPGWDLAGLAPTIQSFADLMDTVDAMVAAAVGGAGV
jgi:DNA-binding transcriptional MerR regulator